MIKRGSQSLAELPSTPPSGDLRPDAPLMSQTPVSLKVLDVSFHPSVMAVPGNDISSGVSGGLLAETLSLPGITAWPAQS